MLGVLTLVTSKGGAGKSTLARSLAAHWLMVGHKPALIDADPQRSLANRHDPEGKLGGVSLIAEPEQRVREVIEDLRRHHAPLIVDTAGFRNRTSIYALVASDIALIPLKPSAEDVEAAVATYELIQEINGTPERKRKSDPGRDGADDDDAWHGHLPARQEPARRRRPAGAEGRDEQSRLLSRDRDRRAEPERR